MALLTFNDRTISSTLDIMTTIHGWLTGLATDPWNSVDGIVGSQVDLDLNNCYVQFTWTTSDITIFQSLSSATTITPGSESGDVGFDSLVDSPVVITDAELWGFVSEHATEGFAHFVLEYNKDGQYIHFGWGNEPAADKFFTWTGGAYKYGYHWDVGVGNAFLPGDTAHRTCIDSNHTSSAQSTAGNLATMTASGLRGQDVNSAYLAFTSVAIANITSKNDANADPISAGFSYARGGPWLHNAIHVPVSPNNASINLLPIVFGYRPADNDILPLGRVPNIRSCNIADIQPKEQLTFDGETWQFFPWAQKLTLTSGTTPASRNAGLAYRVS